MANQSPSIPPAPVLLAVSHEQARDLLADRLRRADADVQSVGNGTDARREIQEQAFGVVVAETRLPGRSGLELLRSFPTLRPPFVLLGQQGNDEEIERAFELGAADYFTLPFSPSIATARVMRVPRLVAAASGSRFVSE